MGDGGSVRSRDALPAMIRVLLVLGFAVAAAATVLVVMADSVRLMRLAAVLALWAALIAAFAVSRSRRDARAAAMREREAELAYQLELNREVTARREYEAELADSVARSQSEQIEELRAQLERLTDVLASLADGEVTVSRLTLSAESARFRARQQVAAGARTSVTSGRGSDALDGAPVDRDGGDEFDASGADDEPIDAEWVEETVEGPMEPHTADITPTRSDEADVPAAVWAAEHVARTRARFQSGPASVAAPPVAVPAQYSPPTEPAVAATVTAGPNADVFEAAPEPAAAMAAEPAPSPTPAGEPDREPVAASESAPEPAPVPSPEGDEHPAARPTPPPAPAGAAPWDRQPAHGSHASDEEAAEPVRSGGEVSVSDLLAAYGLSGQTRRRRRG